VNALNLLERKIDFDKGGNLMLGCWHNKQVTAVVHFTFWQNNCAPADVDLKACDLEETISAVSDCCQLT